MGLVGDLLEKAARATPAAVEHRRTGWWLRYTDNVTWWSGAVLAHGAADDLERRIDAAERFYAERDAIPRFQICPDCPGPLDQVLAERGYRWDAAVLLLTAMAATPAGECAPTGATVRLDDSLGPEWLAVLSSTTEPETEVDHETRLLPGVDRPQAYVTACIGSDQSGSAELSWMTPGRGSSTWPQRRRRGGEVSAGWSFPRSGAGPKTEAPPSSICRSSGQTQGHAAYTTPRALRSWRRTTTASEKGSGVAECRGSGLHRS